MDISLEEKTLLLAEHYKYEVDMLFMTWQKLNALTIDVNTHNAILESFLLHSRNLIEFYYDLKKYKNSDARAHDYFDEKIKWEDIRPNIDYKDFKININKQISHLTYDRVKFTLSDKAWTPLYIMIELFQITKIFISKLPSKYSHQNLKYVLDYVDDTLKKLLIE